MTDTTEERPSGGLALDLHHDRLGLGEELAAQVAALAADAGAPRQAAIDALTLDESLIRGIALPTRLHVFGRCGHWVQIEKAQQFNRLLAGFLG